jgi:hypothetical protein
MNAPNILTHQLVDSIQGERLAHAERMRLVAQDRQPGGVAYDRDAQRRITARRLALGAAATLLAAALAVGGAAGNAAEAGGSVNGGGPVLHR